jgi:hypothetical protein
VRYNTNADIQTRLTQNTRNNISLTYPFPQWLLQAYWPPTMLSLAQPAPCIHARAHASDSLKPRWTAWLEVLNIPVACKASTPFLSNRLSTSIDLPSNLKPSSAAWRTTATQGTAQGTPSPSHAHYRCIQAAKPSNTTGITACSHLLDGKDGIHTHEQHCG